jgi:hypothetical protein
MADAIVLRDLTFEDGAFAPEDHDQRMLLELA